MKLVETILDNRFEETEREIRDKCIQIYLDEMQQRGISFSEDPNRLYRMAYLMRVLEKELRRNLRATLKGKRPFVSQQVLKKFQCLVMNCISFKYSNEHIMGKTQF